MTIARKLLIKGRVQGVFYRGWMVEQAQGLGVAGWVRNRAGGDVEALVIGAPDAVAALIERCRGGPAAARVTGITVEEAEIVEAEGFRQRPTV
jgi:acylphosphatase